jgi:hypothetical protein
MNVEVHGPKNSQVTDGDLNSCVAAQGMEVRGHTTIIKAQVPLRNAQLCLD